MSDRDILHDAYLGSLVADALAMPVHWYYDRSEIDREYGLVDRYLPPKNPHQGSILFRSKYEALNEKGDILGDQAAFWGQHGIHYHQNLQAGDNTVNFKLGMELYRQVVESGSYSGEAWLQRYIDLMLEPGWHGDTYLEEYHRAFFTHYAEGKEPSDCGIPDIHIGGLAHVPALVAAIVKTGAENEADVLAIVEEHVRHTHTAAVTLGSAAIVAKVLLLQHQGESLRRAIELGAQGMIGPSKLNKWCGKEDRVVIGRVLSPACYLPESLVAALYLAWKYHDDFHAGITANAMVGGDSCHRGAVVGALLGAENGVESEWVTGLVAQVD